LTGWLAHLRASDSGSTAVEFAFLAPAFLMLLLGAIFLAQALWQFQALQAVAASTARCAAIGESTCSTQAGAQSYFATTAASYGVGGVTAGNVTVSASDTCGTTVPSNSFTKISLNYTITNLIASLLPLPSGVTVWACYPNSP